jgi:hypothetical protein
MNELARWFEHEARRQRRAVYLEEALLGNRFWAYAFHRLRFFFARYAVESLIHAVTVLLLYRFFDRTHFVVVLVAYAVAGVLSSFWWGSLEAMRGEVRRLYRLRAPHLIPKAIGRWLSLSVQLALLSVLAIVLWLALYFARGGTLKPATLYVVAIGLRLALQFVTRAYHSGMYAIRRIYRPLPAILGVEVAGVTVAVALSPVIGAWALPVGALVAAPAVAGLSLYFTSRAYGFLGLSPVRFVNVTSRWLPPRRALRDLLGGGFSYALAGVDSLLVLVLFTTERSSLGKTGLFALFFLLSPTVRAGSEWAQLMYFDLKRLEIHLFHNLRRRFERGILRLAVALGLLFSGMATLIGTLVYRASLGDLAWVLVPFFVSISLLAAVQIAAFAERAYTALAGNAGLCLAGYLAASFFAHGERATVLLLTAVAIVGFLLLSARRERLASGGGRVLWPVEWLATVRTVDFPARVAAARFCADRGAVEDDAWRRQQIAGRITRRLGRTGRAALIEPELLVWYERPGAEPAIDERSLPLLSGGLLEWIGSRSARDGAAALRAAAAADLLGRDLAKIVTHPKPRLDVEELRSSFERIFTSGIVYSPDEPIPAQLAALPIEDKRAALVEAVAFARELCVQRPRSGFHVTALCEGGELRLIFLASRRAPRHLRARWETSIRRANLEAALASPDATKTAGRAQRYRPLARRQPIVDARVA